MKYNKDKSAIRGVLTSFIWVLFLFVVMSVSTIYVINSLAQSLDDLVVDKNEKVKIMNNILKLSRERSLLLQSMLLTKDPYETDKIVIKMSALVSSYKALREDLGAYPLSPEELELYTLQHQQSLLTGTIQSKVVKLIVDEQYQEAKKLFFEKSIPSQNKAMNKMEEFISFQQQHIYRDLLQNQDDIKISRIVFIVLAIISFVTSVILATWMIKRLSSEIERRNRIEAELEQRVEERTEKLQYSANHDALTSLPNRTMFTGQMELAIERAKRNKNRCALFFMDLDGFKQINDRYGHDTGDQVLVKISGILKNLIRSEDAIARLGGDEFTLLICDIKQDSDAEEIASKIIKAVAEPVSCKDNIKCQVGISIGIAFFPDDAFEKDSLLTRADDYMYVAKRSGKNRYATSADKQDD